MQITQLVSTLGRNDVKLIGRDRFLAAMFGFVVLIAVVLRLGLPWLNTYLAATGVMPSDAMPMRLADIYPMLVAYMAIYTGPLLVGTVFGFVLLDEKDDHTLKAMLVTPIPLRQYALYRVGLAAILAFVVIVVETLFINQALPPLWQLLLISAGAALTAPIVSLFFATVAENKVAGFAYSKFGGTLGMTIMIGFFVPEPWQWLIGLFPPFWICKAYWMALAGHGWWAGALTVGIVLQLAMIGWFMQRFDKVAHC